eukprot:COSAG01_NODE_15324_length_1348_cov_39.875100_3_plen_31_part_01
MVAPAHPPCFAQPWHATAPMAQSSTSAGTQQ